MNYPTEAAHATERRMQDEGELEDYEMRSVHSDGSISYYSPINTIKIDANGRAVIRTLIKERL